MSEFIEIGGMILRRSAILGVSPCEDNFVYIEYGDDVAKASESYESVRAKLIGETAPKSKQIDVEEFLNWCVTCDDTGVAPMDARYIALDIPRIKLYGVVENLVNCYLIDTGKTKCD